MFAFYPDALQERRLLPGESLNADLLPAQSREPRASGPRRPGGQRKQRLASTQNAAPRMSPGGLAGTVGAVPAEGSGAAPAKAAWGLLTAPMWAIQALHLAGLHSGPNGAQSRVQALV